MDFRGVQAWDAQTAIVMASGPGDKSRLYKTTDGCKSWKLVFTNPDKDGFWDTVSFNRSQSGWLLGDPVKGAFVLFRSDDGGKSWIRQQSKGLNVIQGLPGAFAASNSALFAHDVLVVFGSGGTGGTFSFTRIQTEICVDDCSPEDLDLHGRKDKWGRQHVPVGYSAEASGHLFNCCTCRFAHPFHSDAHTHRRRRRLHQTQ